MSDDHLNHDFFARLAAKMPQYKRELAKKFQAKKASGNGKLLQPPCLCCGKHFGSKVEEFSARPLTPKPYCPTCQKHLDSNGTALLNAAGTRWALVTFKDEKTILALRTKFPEFNDWMLADLTGKVKAVSDRFLDLVKQQEHAASAKVPGV